MQIFILLYLVISFIVLIIAIRQVLSWDSALHWLWRTLSVRKVKWWAILLGLSPLVALYLSFEVHEIWKGSPVDLTEIITGNALYSSIHILRFAFPLVFFAILEELGFRGFILPFLQEKWNALFSSLILWVIWIFWQLPLFLFYFKPSTGNIASILLTALAMTFLLNFLFNSTRGSLWICILWHANWNLVYSLHPDGLTIILSALLIFLAILIPFIFGIKNLSWRDRVTISSH